MHIPRVLLLIRQTANPKTLTKSFRLAHAILTGGLLTCAAFNGAAQTSLTLAWDPSPSTNVIGYNLYYGSGTGAYSTVVPAGNALMVTVSNLVEGSTYYFAATALDSDGLESDYSAELSYTTLAPPVIITNTAPTISSIASQGIVQDTSTAVLYFTVGDDQTAASNLSVQATSSDPLLVPGANILLGGSGSTRTVQVFPAAGMVGTATIELKVTDGELFSSTSFLVTVDALRVAVQNVTIAAASGAISAPFTVQGGVVSQPVATTVSAGGRAIYDFAIAEPGNYTVSILVKAPTSKNNALYVNIDGFPQETSMIWDIPITKNFAQRTVSWRGNGTDRKPQYSPKVFSLSAGTHQLVIGGREPQTQFSEIQIVPSTAPLAAAALFASATVQPEQWLSLDEIHEGFLVSWPTDSNTWVLEQASAPEQADWAPVEAAPDNDGLTTSVVVPADAGNHFYRLRTN